MEEHPFPDALTRLKGNDKLLLDVARIVAKDAPSELAQLDAAARDGNVGALAARAHTLKGMLATFADGSPVTELGAVEVAAKKDRLAEARTSLEACRVDVESFIARLERFASE